MRTLIGARCSFTANSSPRLFGAFATAERHDAHVAEVDARIGVVVHERDGAVECTLADEVVHQLAVQEDAVALAGDLDVVVVPVAGASPAMRDGAATSAIAPVVRIASVPRLSIAHLVAAS